MYTFHEYYLTAHLFRKSRHDIYLAYRRDKPEHRVVLKVFDAECLVPETTLSDFRQMETRLQGLKHPYIVAVLELGIEQGKPYIVSEYQAGGSLRQYQEQQASEYLSLEEAVGVVMQVGQAVAFAHTHGVLHQDIRPENILLNEQGKALLADFRVGIFIEKPGQQSASERRVSYQAPEQVIGAASVASDQYALGCLLYELMTGTVPDPPVLRQQATLTTLVAPTTLPTLPRQVEAVILRTLAMKPRERYPDVATLLAELKAVVQPEPPAFPFAHLTAQYQQTSSPGEQELMEAFPPLLPITPFEAKTPQEESSSQESPTFTSLEAFLTIPEWGGVSLLDRLIAADGQENVTILSGASKIDASSREPLPTSEVQEQKIDETDSLEEMPLAIFLGKDFSAQPRDLDARVRQEELLVAAAEGNPVFPPILDEINKVTGTVQAQLPVTDKMNYVKNTRRTTDATQSSMNSAPMRTQGSFTPPLLSDWKRPVVLLGVALTLTIISTLLMYSFDARVIATVKHAPLAEVVKPTLQPMPMPTSQPTLQPMPMPTSQPTSQPTPVPTSQPTLEPNVSYEAESPLNTRASNLKEFSCAFCSGGERIGWIYGNDTLGFNDVVAYHNGSYMLRVYYYNSIPNRVTQLYVSVNGNANVEADLQIATINCCDYYPYVTIVAIRLQTGNNTITLSNPNGPAPDIDRIVVVP